MKTFLKTKKWILLLALIAIGVAVYFFTRPTTNKPTFKEEIVQRGPIEVSILSTGTVKPENRVAIKPPISGRAESVLVNEGQKVSRGQILMWTSSTERAALLDAARARGKEELKKWEELYQATPIIAPVSGTIIQRSIEPGQSFVSTDSVLVMSDRLIVEAQVDETDLAQIRLKQNATLTLDSYAGQPFQGQVESIAYEATTVNNVTTYTVKILPLEIPGTMRSGMTTNVKFQLSSKENALLISNEALKNTGGTTSVFLKAAKDQPPTTVNVQTGLTDGKRTEITEGLAENDVVLIPQALKADGGKKEASSPFGLPQPSRRGTGGGGRK